MMNITPTVKQLLIINVLFFIGTQLLSNGPAAPNPAYDALSLYYPEHPNFQVWQPLTHMFMHGNLMHILFNMFALYSFGSALEQLWGSGKFLFFYISCGLGAALLHTAVNWYFFDNGLNVLLEAGFQKSDIVGLLSEGKYDMRWQEHLSAGRLETFLSAFSTPAVGASGAIYGLLVAFAFMYPNMALMMLFIPIPIKAKYFVPGILLLDLYLGISGKSIFGGSSGVAHFAHIGGALIGFLMMWYWRKNQFRNNRWD